MDGFAVIATHHKTGSLWMYRVFKHIGRKLGIAFFKMEQKGQQEWRNPEVPAIIFNNHSNFRRAPELLQHSKARVVHLIRDPRDIIVSGMHYHRKAREHWLRRPDPELGGMSYQQTLNSLATDRSRYLFEMQHNAKRTINGMRRWNYTRSNSMECKYEQLIEDTKMAMFTRIIEHLGFTPDEQEECRNQFWDVSLFGKGREFKPAHVRSGASRQWKSTFDKGLADEFIKEFGDILIELGYEMDHSWIESLSDPVRPPPATDN